MASVEVLRYLWDSRPLASRLVAVVVVLLTFGLVMSGTVMIGLLQRHLISQIDDQLVNAADAMVKRTQDFNKTTASSLLPSQYYVHRVMTDSEPLVLVDSRTTAKYGTPQIPELLAISETPQNTNTATTPITVTSSQEGSNWRVVSIPLVVLKKNQEHVPVGVITIALPLADVQATLRTTAFYVTTTGLAIIVLGGSLGLYFVRRALLPLRAIEYTAGKIAAGDLTQRIIPQPPTTEVGSLATSLNIMLSQVETSFAAREESERKIRRFVSDASHELRTPLAAIRGYCELFAMGGVPEERTSEVMGRIQSESTRMGNLVEDLLTLARLDEGRPLELAAVDLVKMADNALFDLQALDPTRSVALIALQGRIPPKSLVVQADKDRIQQVFTNLVGNIVRYTPAGSPVELAIGSSDTMAIVEFRDHGPGIATQDRERVFERFYRTENSRNRSLGGSGLGLAIVASILSVHQGGAQLTRTHGGGLTVRIELPLCRSEAHIAAMKGTDSASTPATINEGGASTTSAPTPAAAPAAGAPPSGRPAAAPPPSESAPRPPAAPTPAPPTPGTAVPYPAPSPALVPGNAPATPPSTPSAAPTSRPSPQQPAPPARPSTPPRRTDQPSPTGPPSRRTSKTRPAPAPPVQPSAPQSPAEPAEHSHGIPSRSAVHRRSSATSEPSSTTIQRITPAAGQPPLRSRRASSSPSRTSPPPSGTPRALPEPYTPPSPRHRASPGVRSYDGYGTGTPQPGTPHAGIPTTPPLGTPHTGTPTGDGYGQHSATDGYGKSRRAPLDGDTHHPK